MSQDVRIRSIGYWRYHGDDDDLQYFKLDVYEGLSMFLLFFAAREIEN